MQVSTNPMPYLNYQVWAQSAASGTDGGQDVPGLAADPAPASAQAAAVAGSTPGSPFSSAVLNQLIQAQADGATQAARHGRHGHRHHAGEPGQAAADAQSATATTDGGAASLDASSADASTEGASPGAALAPAILS